MGWRSKMWHVSNIVVSVFVLGLLFRRVSAADRDCYKQDPNTAVEANTVDIYARGYDPNNIFLCDAAKTCCVENDVSSCCSDSPDNKGIFENVGLWLGIIGAFLLIGAIVFYFRSDIFICDSTGKKGKSCAEKCCCCCRSSEDSNQIEDLEDLPRDSAFNSRHSLADPSGEREMAYRQTIPGDTLPAEASAADGYGTGQPYDAYTGTY